LLYSFLFWGWSFVQFVIINVYVFLLCCDLQQGRKGRGLGNVRKGILRTRKERGREGWKGDKSFSKWEEEVRWRTG
jgi:hypothetical protein